MSDTSAPISYQPTKGLTYDPDQAAYWDPELLDLEVKRAFEICHGCRMCFKYCDSFPILFGRLDQAHDGDVHKLSQSEKTRVMDACFQCKLCEVQCPYTPRDKHEYQLDFPKLVHRYQAVRAKSTDPTLRDRVLGDPDGTAKLARMSFGMANAMNKVNVHRWFMEKLLGIHRDKQLPPFAGETFSRWAEKNDRMKQPGGEAVLFATCYVENNEPQVGKDTLAVMDKNQVEVGCTQGLVCCGMPAWEHGDLESLQKQARRNLDVLEPWVDKGAKVLVINPTCSMMLRKEYPELVAENERPRAKKIAEAVRDPAEHLWSIRNEPRFSTDFKSSPGSVSYHAPCHLRAQSIGFKGRDLLKKIPGVQPKSVLECCGHDGSYGMKVETFEASARIGQKSFEGMKNGEADTWVTECPLAATQFEQHAGKKALHPMTVLARAYRTDGFEQKVGPEAPKEETS